MNPMNPIAIVQQVESVAECFAAARAADGDAMMFVDRSIEAIRRRGEALLKAKEAVGHGNWAAALKKHWPGLSDRTARHYMAQVKSANLADLKARIEASTHPSESDADFELTPNYKLARESLRRLRDEIIDDDDFPSDVDDIGEKLRFLGRIANDHELETWSAEIKLRAMRCVGELLKPVHHAGSTVIEQSRNSIPRPDV